jgi:hypothetical protein
MSALTAMTAHAARQFRVAAARAICGYDRTSSIPGGWRTMGS